MTTNIPAALSAFTSAIDSVAAEKARIHAEHLFANAGCSNAVSDETARALAALKAAGDVALITLVAELCLVDVNAGTHSPDKKMDEATIADIDLKLEAIDAARKALAASRANIDARLEAIVDAAKVARAKLFIDNVEI